MMKQGDTTTTEIDGVEYRVEVIRTNLERQYVEDILQAEASATDFTRVDEGTLRVQPDYECAVFNEEEMEEIDEHPDWTLVDANGAEYGPSLTLRYDG